MRQIYESPLDKKNEQEVVDKLAKVWNVELRSLSHLSRLDRAIVDNAASQRILGFVEIKVRKVPRNQHETIFIAMNKIINMAAVAMLTELPVYLAIQWSDYLGIWHWAPCRLVSTLTGRTQQTRDKFDVEPMSHIPVNWFADPKSWDPRWITKM